MKRTCRRRIRKAVTMIQALAAGDRQSFMKVVAEDPKLLNARGPEGSTPFMYAVLYPTLPPCANCCKRAPIRTRATMRMQRR